MHDLATIRERNEPARLAEHRKKVLRWAEAYIAPDDAELTLEQALLAMADRIQDDLGHASG